MELLGAGLDPARAPGEPWPSREFRADPRTWEVSAFWPVVTGIDAEGFLGDLEPGEVTLKMGVLELVATATPETCEGGGKALRIGLRLRHPKNPGAAPLAIGSLRVGLSSVVLERVLEHGWQSWSPVRSTAPGDVRPSRSLVPAWTRAISHAAPWLAGHAVCGEPFLLWKGEGRAGIAGVLESGRTFVSVVAVPLGTDERGLALSVRGTDRPRIWVVFWLDGVELAPGEERELDPLWLAEGAKEQAGGLMSRFASAWGREGMARSQAPSPSGWCTWYEWFHRLKAEHVTKCLGLLASHGLEVAQVDDHWQREVGDWNELSDEFKQAFGDPAGLARTISGAGLSPGVWSAPFVVTRRSRVALKHPEWLARSATGGPLRSFWNPLAWKGWALALDTTNPGVLDHLRGTYQKLAQDGFEYFKIDFCFAAGVASRREDGIRHTRAQSLQAGLQAVRDGIGPDAYLLGCGCPFGPAVGIVDAMRVSPDTGPYWSTGPLSLPGYRETLPSSLNALSTSALRASLHRRLWVNDPDCLMLRDWNTRLSPTEREAAATFVAETGQLGFISDDVTRYDEATWNLLGQVMGKRESKHGSCDVADPFGEDPWRWVVASPPGIVMA
jgi:hypothetical protein